MVATNLRLALSISSIRRTFGDGAVVSDDVDSGNNYARWISATTTRWRCHGAEPRLFKFAKTQCRHWAA